jgi:hypothetical protein
VVIAHDASKSALTSANPDAKLRDFASVFLYAECRGFSQRSSARAQSAAGRSKGLISPAAAECFTAHRSAPARAANASRGINPVPDGAIGFAPARVRA